MPKHLDSLAIAAAAVLGIVGLFIDERIRAIAPLVGMVGLFFWSAHLLQRRRQRHAAARTISRQDIGS
jgi:hypothetical protein